MADTAIKILADAIKGLNEADEKTISDAKADLVAKADKFGADEVSGINDHTAEYDKSHASDIESREASMKNFEEHYKDQLGKLQNDPGGIINSIKEVKDEADADEAALNATVDKAKKGLEAQIAEEIAAMGTIDDVTLIINDSFEVVDPSPDAGAM